MGQDRNKDADVENGFEDTGRGKERSERVAWTYIHYQEKYFFKHFSLFSKNNNNKNLISAVNK